MTKPKIFIGSSSERKDNANDLQVAICEWSTPVVWDEIFVLSNTTIEDLERELPMYDMCVFLWTSDDEALVRGEQYKIARDNLIFEAGMSYAYIGRQNTIIVIEDGVKGISDLNGVTLFRHDFSQSIKIIATKLKSHYARKIKNTDNLPVPGYLEEMSENAVRLSEQSKQMALDAEKKAVNASERAKDAFQNSKKRSCKENGTGFVYYIDEKDNIYGGEGIDSILSGYGVEHCKNGDTYSGQWKNGVWCGFGILTTKSGAYFAREWGIGHYYAVCNKIHHEHCFYVGEMIDEEVDGIIYHYYKGYGICSCGGKGKAVYKGQFVKNLWHGYGIEYDKAGNPLRYGKWDEEVFITGKVAK